MCIACEVRTMKEQIQALQAEVYRSNKRFEKSMLENSNLRSAIGYRNDDIHHLENLLREKDDQIQHLHETGISRQRQVQELLMQEQQRAVQVQQLQTELFNTKRQKAELERRVNCVVCLVVPVSVFLLSIKYELIIIL